MGDHRRGEQVEPEGDVAAARLALAIAHVPAHSVGKDRKAAGKDQAEEKGLRGFPGQAGGGDNQRDGRAGDRGRAGGNGDRHVEAPPVQPGTCRSEEEGARKNDGAGAVVHAVVGQTLNYLERSRDQPADERQQQHDRGQRHAPGLGEVLGHAPRRRGNQQPADAWRDGLANAAHRHEQQHRGDGHEDVVEAVEEPEGLFVGSGRDARAFHISPQALGRLGADRSGSDRVADVLFAVHWWILPKIDAGRIG